jgi:hypothetical protein
MLVECLRKARNEHDYNQIAWANVLLNTAANILSCSVRIFVPQFFLEHNVIIASRLITSEITSEIWQCPHFGGRVQLAH